MPKVSPIQNNFNAGEFSPLLYGRVDIEKYKSALKTCLNHVLYVQGGATRRPGTYFVAEVKDSSKATRVVRFEFSVTQAYIIEFGDHYCRFYKDHGQIQVSGVAAWSGATNYVVGDLAEQAGVNYYCKVAHVNQAPPNATYWHALTGTIFEIPTPYDEADIFELKFTQSADVLYIAHPGYAPRKLSRTGHTAWTLTEIDFLDGPYLNTNATATTLTLSGTTGSVTVTASAAAGINDGQGFLSSDVGRLIRWKDPAGNWTWLEITAWTSATVVTATIRGANASGTTATVNWRLGLWSAYTGYPGAVSFYEDRLFWGGSSAYPTRIDGSKSGDYENMEPTAEDGSVADDNAVAFSLNANEVNVIRWLMEDEKGLLAGTVGGEWLVRPSAASEALSPTNVSAKKSTAYGSANCAPVRAGRATLFVQRHRRKIRELAYLFEVDGFRAPDLTVLSEHITSSGIKEIAYQQEPQSIVWAVRNDGVLAGLTYERDQEVVGWHRHTLGGSFGTGSAVAESAACIPAPDGTRDEAWLVVKRTINGTTVRYIEYMTKLFDDDDAQEDAFFVDCGLTYDGAAVTTIAGLDHLEGETVAVLADGATHPDCAVASGQITLDRPASVVQAGLAYRSDGQMLRLDAGAADGTAQGKLQRAHLATFRLHNAAGLLVGRDFDNLDAIPFRDSEDDTGAAVPLFTGDKEVSWDGDYTTENYFCWRVEQPVPCTVLAVMPQLHTQDRG